MTIPETDEVVGMITYLIDVRLPLLSLARSLSIN